MLTPTDFLILGHRGASAYAADNSREAFRIAAEQGADGVELDVRRTADDRLVVHHDPTVGDGTVIVEAELEDLRRRAPGLLTLAEAMEACDGMLVNVEIKNSPSDPDFDPAHRSADMTVRWLVDHGWDDRVIVSSFNPATIDRVRSLSDDISTGQLLVPGSEVEAAVVSARERGHNAVHPHGSQLTDPIPAITAARERSMLVLVWTVNDPGFARRLRDAGATGIITDDPAAIRSGLAPA
ncbi:MAG: glycerophosphodiester phosphodiesterase [Acidimicrobiia bacterium]|nr:glycerophosphodiester phosphodiesterase [Acidimicrobiia bacterium]MBT8216504.1 glycerophosphodiester phosphodiesterase [Acidimicrobiia bacterium]NNF11028.1 glycerophosphodiester phosphodiesterase [Acidimicrobiia bacterium]NNL69178.1 glycerophosphodiester phosphodiesterase [Acidimicrobiia bacterium]